MRLGVIILLEPVIDGDLGLLLSRKPLGILVGIAIDSYARYADADGTSLSCAPASALEKTAGPTPFGAPHTSRN